MCDEDDRQPCGCPVEYHLADCNGSPAERNTKEYWLDFYSRYDSMDDAPDTDGW